MNDRFANDTFDNRDRDYRAPAERDDRDDRYRDEPPDDYPPLPEHLAARLLQPGEAVEWVRGPRRAPSWEKYVTHPLLFLAALALGVVSVAVGAAAGGPKSPELGAGLGVAMALVIGSIFVLGFFNGHFTRLVVTTERVVIMQGYEVVRSWGLDDLPRSMIRYRPGAGADERVPSIDLSTVKTMLGGSPDGFADAKTIMAFGKSLNNVVKGRGEKPR
jgi:hypothetical protein